jgi:TIR domain-containing protein
MPTDPGERYDFFLSRRGSVAAIAQEVADVLTEKGYKVFVQDYDIPLTANLIEKMHEGIKNSRDLVVLFTRDYEQSPYTRMEFTSFEANAAAWLRLCPSQRRPRHQGAAGLARA